MSVVCYAWPKIHGYLFHEICPEVKIHPFQFDGGPKFILRNIREHWKGVAYFLYHIDLTETWREPWCRQYLNNALSEERVRVINGGVGDISKRTLHAVLEMCKLPHLGAEAAGDPDETLIVKSNLNYGGKLERKLEGYQGHLPEHMNSSNDYFIKPRRQVDFGTWLKEEYVVERYVDNSEHLFLRAYFLLDRWVISAVHNDSPIKKMYTGIQRCDSFSWTNDPIKGQAYKTLAHVRAVMGLDYGTADFVVDESGYPFLIDVNTTPWWGEAHKEIPTHLRQAICSN